MMPRCDKCGAGVDAKESPYFSEHTREVVTKFGREKLRPIVWDILQVLRSREGKTVPVDFLIRAAYGMQEYPDPQLIKVYICQLRRALSRTPYAIKTHYKAGYQLVMMEDANE